MFTAQAAEQLRQRLILAMSMDEAKTLLGFPPFASPSDKEVTKALRIRTFQNHPDKGGDPRKQVELNVAADILRGMRREDRTQVTRDPEEERRQKEALQRKQDIKDIEAAKKRAVEYMDRAIYALEGINPTSKMDLKKFLVGTFADQLDLLQDAADKALRDRDLDPKDQKVWQAVKRHTEGIGGMALRLGSKFGKLKKDLKALRVSASNYDLIGFRKRAEEYVENFQELWDRTRALNRILNTTEAVPLKIVDEYWDGASIVDAFARDYLRLRFDLKQHISRVKDEIQEVVEILDRRGIRDVAPSATFMWAIPGEFEVILDHIERTRNASAQRVATRFSQT